MTDVQERRARGAGRVELATLVEICGNEPGIPAFEAEAVDVSARGMHLRTAYLPDDGAPLVCRFEEGGREIIVEGVVAWRREAEKGGEFGIKFTALDSRSVDALRELVKANVKEREGGGGDSGSRVRLHIEGLGSPMKARVREGTRRKVQVGSSLEFLRVGRKLEVEDIEAGERRIARIDGVDVTIDPETQVPQLVVGLRYEGSDEDTPQPSVMDLGADPVRPAAMRLDARAVTASPGASESDLTPSGELPETAARGEDTGDADEDDIDESAGGAVPAATIAARRLGQAAENAGQVAKHAGEAAMRVGSGALRGFGQLLRGAGSKVSSSMRDRDARAPRRTTAPPPDGKVSLEGKRLRPQASSRGEAAEPKAPEAKPKLARKRLVAGAAATLVLATGLGFAFRGSSKPAAGSAAPAAAKVAALPATTALTTNAATPADGAQSPVSASVPLFGPTPLATLEPAPLGPPPGAETEITEASERRAASEAAPETIPDEAFADAPSRSADAARGAISAKKTSAGVAKEASTSKPEDVPAWGRGRMNMPVIHRIRLDAPGAIIRGAVDPMGFTVLIPDRKMMESGTAIGQRDARIAKVRTTNTPGGAQLRVGFRSAVPAYRVRLRRDYLEILISSPAEKK
jgi:hypothetical protein